MAFKRAGSTRWFWIMTIKRFWNDQNGQETTGSGTIDVRPGQTRREIFDQLYQDVIKYAEAEAAYVLYFSLEPDDPLPHGGHASASPEGSSTARQGSELTIRLPGRHVQRIIRTGPAASA